MCSSTCTCRNGKYAATPPLLEHPYECVHPHVRRPQTLCWTQINLWGLSEQLVTVHFILTETLQLCWKGTSCGKTWKLTLTIRQQSAFTPSPPSLSLSLSLTLLTHRVFVRHSVVLLQKNSQLILLIGFHSPPPFLLNLSCCAGHGEEKKEEITFDKCTLTNRTNTQQR